ncbi:MAG: hypothetical protein ACTSX8_08520 [Alphaproteobacteria bacterium]
MALDWSKLTLIQPGVTYADTGDGLFASASYLMAFADDGSEPDRGDTFPQGGSLKADNVEKVPLSTKAGDPTVYIVNVTGKPSLSTGSFGGDGQPLVDQFTQTYGAQDFFFSAKMCGLRKRTQKEIRLIPTSKGYNSWDLDPPAAYQSECQGWFPDRLKADEKNMDEEAGAFVLWGDWAGVPTFENPFTTQVDPRYANLRVPLDIATITFYALTSGGWDKWQEFTGVDDGSQIPAKYNAGIPDRTTASVWKSVSQNIEQLTDVEGTSHLRIRRIIIRAPQFKGVVSDTDSFKAAPNNMIWDNAKNGGAMTWEV